MQGILPLEIPIYNSHSENRQKYTKYNNTTDQIYTYTKILILHLEVCLQNILKILELPCNYPITPRYPVISH